MLTGLESPVDLTYGVHALTPLWFLLAALVLDAFDISLPRGDSIGVSGAVNAAALVVLGPQWAVAICIGSVLVTHLFRYGVKGRRRIVGAALSRGVALSASALSAVAFSHYPLEFRAVAVAALPAIYLITELTASQSVAAVATRRPLGRLVRGNLRVQAPLLAAQWSTSVLLLIAFDGMGAWSLIPVVALLFLMRQSYAMLRDIRELYRTTVEVLVEAAEGQDIRRVGHAERTASKARAIATRLGLATNQVERISYAALLHDVDALGEMTELVIERDSEHVFSVGSSSVLFEGIRFFDDVLPIIRVCDGNPGSETGHSQADVLAGLIVALASDVDAVENRHVAAAHMGCSIDRVAPSASPSMKSVVVGAALALGYRVPAVG